MNCAAIQAIIHEDSLDPFKTALGPLVLWLSSLLSDAVLHGLPCGFAFEDLGKLCCGAEMGEAGFRVLEGSICGLRGDGKERAGGELGGEEEVVSMVVYDGGSVDGFRKGIHGTGGMVQWEEINWRVAGSNTSDRIGRCLYALPQLPSDYCLPVA